jgi:hypothetical protein
MPRTHFQSKMWVTISPRRDGSHSEVDSFRPLLTANTHCPLPTADFPLPTSHCLLPSLPLPELSRHDPSGQELS